MTATFDPQNDAEFDRYVGRYQEMHAAVLAPSGEDPEYFAAYKCEVIRSIIRTDDRPVLDFGCGIGNLTCLLGREFDQVHGYDPSAESISVARDRTPTATFYDDIRTIAPASFGSIIVANVLHHVPPSERLGLLDEIVRLLAPGGRLVVIEHNRWNPVTVRAVRRCEFDVGVQLLSQPELRRLLSKSGLVDAHSRFIVFFPNFLRVLRKFERHLGALPLGAQVCVWSHKSH